jgi:hypothetical protein
LFSFELNKPRIGFDQCSCMDSCEGSYMWTPVKAAVWTAVKAAVLWKQLHYLTGLLHLISKNGWNRLVLRENSENLATVYWRRGGGPFQYSVRYPPPPPTPLPPSPPISPRVSNQSSELLVFPATSICSSKKPTEIDR